VDKLPAFPAQDVRAVREPKLDVEGKARDSEHCGPFQIVDGPYVDRTGDFQLLKAPEQCGYPADEQPEPNRGGGAPEAQRDAKAANLAPMREWLNTKPDLTNADLREKFRVADVQVNDSTVCGHWATLKKEQK
jgi:hypothetical protein